MLVQQIFDDPGGALARAGIRGGTRVKTVTITKHSGPTGGSDSMEYLTGGDLIVAVDGKPFLTWAAADALGRGRKPGDTVSVTFYRGHRLMTTKATLDAWPWTPPEA
jgi:S1-C subfamily serine protease